MSGLAFGASMMIRQWKTRSALVIGILHGRLDYLPMAADCLLVTETAVESTGYTNGEIGSMIIYPVQLVIHLLVLRQKRCEKGYLRNARGNLYQ